MKKRIVFSVPILWFLALFSLNAPLSAQDFAFTIPPNATTMSPYNSFITIDTRGNMYIFDVPHSQEPLSQDQVVKLDSRGVEVLRFGSTGSGLGQFQGPKAIAVDRTGNIYVYDEGNDRIQKFDSSGQCILSIAVDFPSFGEPRLFVDDLNDIYVARGPELQRYSSEGQLEFTFEAADTFYYEGPCISVDAQGIIYLNSCAAAPPRGPATMVSKFSRDGMILNQFSIPYAFSWFCVIPPSHPSDPALYYMGDYQRIGGSDYGLSTIRKVNQYLATLSEFDMPHPHGRILSCAADASENLYLYDDTAAIHKISSSGEDLLSVGAGPETGRFYFSDQTAVDSQGNIFVLDEWNYRVQKFDENGNFLLTFGSRGDEKYQFYYPWDLDIGPDDNVYVLDEGNPYPRIIKFSASGYYLGFIHCSDIRPFAIDVDGQGNIYALGYSGIAKLSSTGEPIFVIPPPNYKIFYLAPVYYHDIAVSSSGLVCVLAAGDTFQASGSSIFVYDSAGNIIVQFGSSNYHPYGDGVFQPFPFGGLSGIDFDGNNNLYAAERDCSCIYVFDPSMNLISTFTAPGSGVSGLSQMTGITVDCPGNIIVSDGVNNRIQVFKLGQGSRIKMCLQSDSDSDGVDDACDPCPVDPVNSCNPAKSGSYIVSPEGGVVTTPDGSITIIFPPGAVSSATYVSITDSGRGTLFEVTTDQGNGKALYAVRMNPEGMSFNNPVTIRFYWPDADNNGIVDGTSIREENLRISRNGTVLTPLCRDAPGACNTLENYFEVQITSFSEFALLIINHRPSAESQDVLTNENVPIVITLSGSDDDADPLIFQIINSPSHGVLSGDPPNLTYTPDDNYYGPDSFSFKANDGFVDSNPATVSITVKRIFSFYGFETPIDNPPVVNNAKAGSSIPVKWRITDLDGTPISDSASFKSITSYAESCDAMTNNLVNELEESSAGNSGLQYLGEGYWQYNWKTEKRYAGQCQTMVLNLADGSTHIAYFRFK